MSVTLTGGPFADAKGTAVASGKLRLKLNKEGRRSGGQVCPAYQIDIPLDSSGNIQTNMAVYGNDELTPTDTYYTATVFDSNNSPVYGPVQWVLSGGGTVNVNTINPSSGTVSAGVSVNLSADQILLDRANQDILLERDSANVLRLGTGDSFIPQTDAGELGSATKRWLTRLISSVFYGSSSGSTTLQPSATASGTLTLPAATDTLVGKATTDTLTNKTLDTAGAGNVFKINGTQISAITGSGSAVLGTSPTIATPTITSPVVNGTPSGTGIPTLTQKKGSGGGDYTSTSTSYADVDGTNLAYTVTIPTGWKLAINASFAMFVNTAAVQILAALSDGGSVLQEVTTIPNATGNPIPSSLTALIAGDGASHTIKLQFKTTNAADAVGINNTSGNRAPIMVFNLTPSN